MLLVQGLRDVQLYTQIICGTDELSRPDTTSFQALQGSQLLFVSSAKAKRIWVQDQLNRKSDVPVSISAYAIVEEVI
jgi:hypothetical protein